MISCRVCGSTTIGLFTNSRSPKWSQILTCDRTDQPVSITYSRCERCGLVQSDVKNIEECRYQDNVFFSASDLSASYVEYLVNLACVWVERYDLVNKQVLEVGCGDGRFARLLQEQGCEITALDPCSDACERARLLGVESVLNGYLGDDANKLGLFDAVISRHVLEHVISPIQFLRSLRHRTVKGGLVIVEVPNLDSIIAKGRYQDFYADHLSYFNPQSLSHAFARAGLEVAEIYAIEYGDYLVAAGRNRNVDPRKARDGLGNLVEKFAQLIEDSRERGHSVAVWGSGGRSVSLLASTPTEVVSYIDRVVDSNSDKWGFYTPVSHLQVVGPDTLSIKPVDDIIILACSFQREIADQAAKYLTPNGRIGIVSPFPRWLSFTDNCRYSHAT